MAILNSYVELPEGNWFPVMEQWLPVPTIASSRGRGPLSEIEDLKDAAAQLTFAMVSAR